MQIALTIVDGSFSIHSLASDAVIPADVLSASFFAVLRSDVELSLVCPSSVHVEAERTSSGWACLQVAGPLDFGMTGIIAAVSAVLAAASLPIFVIASFDTDYVLVRGADLSKAVVALRAGGMDCDRAGHDGD